MTENKHFDGEETMIRKYDLGAVVHEVTEEAQLRSLEELVARIRQDPETAYENLQKLDELVKRLLQTWNNPPRA